MMENGALSSQILHQSGQVVLKKLAQGAQSNVYVVGPQEDFGESANQLLKIFTED